MVENTGIPIELNSPNFRAFGIRNETITVTLSAEDGSLSAMSNRRVQVDHNEDGSISLTGRPGHIQNLLKKSATVSYTPDDPSGDFGAPALSVSVTKKGEALTLSDAVRAPDEVTAKAGEATRIDFSDLRLWGVSDRKEIIDVTLSVSEGSLSSDGNNRVGVVEHEDGSLTLTGRRADIQRFLKKQAGVDFDAPDATKGKGKVTADLTLSVSKGGDPVTLEDIVRLPEAVIADQAAIDGLDLSGVNLRHFGESKDILIVEIEVEDGVLSAESTKRVEVMQDPDEPGMLRLMGKRNDLQRFMRDVANVTLTENDNEPGENGSYVSLSVINAKDDVSLDDPEDVILSVINNGIRITLGEAVGVPSEILATEDVQSFVDLSDVSLRYFAKGRDVITLEIQVSDGALFAESTDRVTVEMPADNVLQLTGQRRQLEKFLDNVEAISYTGEPDAFGEDAAMLTMNAFTTFGALSLGATSIDIEDVADTRTGTDGDDTIIGDDGQNILLGLGGNDYLMGLGADDTIEGGSGDDDVRGGGGGDRLDGGDGNDVLLYTDSSAGVTINLTADAAGFQQASNGDAEGDVINGFEHVYGSNFNDTITGDDTRNILFGYDGNDNIAALGGDDVVRGGAGADTLDGGDGIDWLRYQSSDAGVTINLMADENGVQSASGGTAEGDVLSNFENIQGSEFDDVLTGSDEANYLIGYGGNDDISGAGGRDIILGGAGADTLDGGDDADTLIYTGSSAGVMVSLVADEGGLQQATGGDAEGDVISGFENVYATNFNDVLMGNDDRNILYGYAGTDILSGGGAADVLRGGSGADVFVFDSALGDRNVDRILDFETGVDRIDLDAAIFDALVAGVLDANNFASNAAGEAQDSDDFIVYDTLTGAVSYDSDGAGGAEAVQFASLTTLAELEATDFFIF